MCGAVARHALIDIEPIVIENSVIVKNTLDWSE